jgi:ABC-type transport system involved in multi-copper enzyme maturation permease subunit
MSRQRWFYVVRSLLVSGLLLGLCAIWWAEVSRLDLTRTSSISKAGEQYFAIIAVAQLSLALMAAPAATAGAFSTEMAHGHVSLMLVTGMTAREIVFGTLCARLLQIVGVVICIVPVLALASNLGGIAPGELVELEVVTVGCAVLGSTLGLTLSIGARRLHEALMATYVLLMGWVLAFPILIMIRLTSLGRFLPGSLQLVAWAINPYRLVLEPLQSPGAYRPYAVWIFLVCSVGLSVALGCLATWQLRRTTLKGPGRPQQRSPLARLASFWPGVSLDSHPVFWRECRSHHPSRWFRLLWGLYVAGALSFTVMAVIEYSAQPTPRTAWPALFNGFQASVGLLLLSLITPAALAEERARGSLEVLLSTPLSSRSIVLGKWCAYYRVVLGLAVLPAVLALVHAIPNERWAGVLLVLGLVLAQGAALTSLGIALATWVRRIDRALIFSAFAAVFITVVWIPLSLILFQNKEWGVGVASASPLLGTALVTSEMVNATHKVWRVRMVWAFVWIVVYSGLAIGLLWATLRSFDRCMGRITPRAAFARTKRPSAIEAAAEQAVA